MSTRGDDDIDETLAGSVALDALLPASALSLAILSPTGSTSVDVPKRGTLVLGRSTECDVRIDDSKLSRKHAELRCGAVIELVDLGSRNGSYVRDERAVANVPFPVRVGDSIAMGSSVLVLQRAAPAGERPRHIWSHGYFEARLEEECARGSREGEPFAILRLRLGAEASEAATKEAAAASATLLAELEGADMLGSYAPHDYEVLFTRTTAADADAKALMLTRKLTATHVTFDLAVAAFPRDGRTPEALIEHASRLLRQRAARGADSATTRAVLTSGALDRMERIIARVAAGVINVLILGETGVGKEVLAQRIHELSPRAKMPLVSLNCAALSESLLESELFGHEKGSFTGAIAAKAGLLESANGGTVLLDEVGEMPLATQAKLLRVLEQREVTRVGALRPKPIDVRFMAATNRNLELEITAGRFRQDLYFRLNGIALSLPPLRERKDEIEPLAQAFIEQACRTMGRSDRPRITVDAMQTLTGYQWPGNIRELRNVIERAVLLCSGVAITRDHLPMEKMGQVLAPSMHLSARPPMVAPRGEEPDEREEPDELTGEIAIPAELDERARVLDALEKCAGNQSQAAKMLGVSRQTIIRRIAEYELPRPRKRE